MSSSYSFSRAHTFSFYRPVDHRDLHSFPTRRSSDLRHRTGRDDHFRAERPQQPRLLLRHLVRHGEDAAIALDRKSTRLNSSHRCISYAVFCLKKKTKKKKQQYDTTQNSTPTT